MVMEELAAYRQQLLAALMRVVAALPPILAARPSRAWNDPPGTTSHGPHFILAHLRALDRQEFMPNLKRIQAETVPLLAVFDDQSWMEAHYQPEEPVDEILEGLEQRRAEEVAWLRDLTTPDWSRLGRHAWWGLRSLQWWVELQLELSRQHQEQIKATLTR